ncbi:MAG: oxidoreductase [Candidatus Helarchaeota archaeon]
MAPDLKMFSPHKIGGLQVKNRFVRSATWEGLADDTGAITEELIELYRTLAKNEIGLITTGFMYVMKNGKAMYRQIGIDRDDLMPGLRKLVKEVKEYDALFFAQLAHGGRQVMDRATKKLGLIAPSPIADATIGIQPREMTQQDIVECVESFITAAQRAYDAGFDGIQLHIAHGYLLSLFLSPYANRRTDEYGGSIENRYRIIHEIIIGIREVVEFPITAKLNIADFVGGAPQLTVEESKQFAKLLAKDGIAAIETSGGIHESALIGNFTASRTNIKRLEDEAYFLQEATIIKQEIGDIPVILVGGLRSKEKIEEVLQIIDFIALARPFIREPDLITKWLSGHSTKAECISCNRCLFEQKRRGLRCVYLERLQKKAGHE